ncbi:MAG: Uma2 family endonuclease [Isosphaeraceae bacterium]
MSTSTRVTFSEYEEMVRRGAFEPREEHRVELIYGEIVLMSPVGPPHQNLVFELTDWSYEVVPQAVARVGVQAAIGIPVLDSEPEPDVFWIRRKDYSLAHPRPEDVFLLIEVSDSSLAKDRGLKARLYAEAGIRDYWVVNVSGLCIEVHREPAASGYGSVMSFRPGQEVRPLAFPDVSLAVARIFPD